MILCLIKKYYKTIVLLFLFFLIDFFEKKSRWVEQYYSNGIYPKISSIQRKLTGGLPVSLGDLIYIILGCFFVFKLSVFLIKLIKHRQRTAVLKKAVIWSVNFFLSVYIVFKLIWGFNYSREGIVYQLKLEKSNYCKEEVVELIEDLIVEANDCRSRISDTTLPKMNIDSIFAQTKTAYGLISKEYSFFTTDCFSIKTSLFSFIGSYLGYTGYYNPFTGEAQIRDDIPKILLPFIACHEVAHQLGYASEDEANFVGYLVASQSDNVYFRYSMCLEILDYALNDLLFKYNEDFELKMGVDKRLQIEDCFDLQVKKDRKLIKLFFAEHTKNASKISSAVYDQYLKMNHQNLGIGSYSEVIQLILSYKFNICRNNRKLIDKSK